MILCHFQRRFREEGIRSIHKKMRIPFLLQKEFLFLQHQGMHIVENLAGIDAYRNPGKPPPLFFAVQMSESYQ